MRLHCTERDYYVAGITADPPVTGTWEASFDGGTTWVDGTPDTPGSEGTTGWGWLVAGPDYDAAAVGQVAGDTDATVTLDTTVPLLRVKDNPVLDVEQGAEITLWR